MIRITGTLIVKKIKQSRNGPFCVADLVTDIGEFKVKDPVLDQFAEGEYRGDFWISEIYLSPYVSFGRGVIELRARLHDLQLDSDGKPLAGDTDDAGEPDPIDETPATRVPRAQRPSGGDKTGTVKLGQSAGHGRVPKAKPTAPIENTDHSAGHDAELFGEEIAPLVASREPVKLDPTIDDRARFRGQTTRLRELGYNFDAKSQTWTLKA